MVLPKTSGARAPPPSSPLHAAAKILPSSQFQPCAPHQLLKSAVQFSTSSPSIPAAPIHLHRCSYLVGSNIAATILEVAAIYLQVGKGDEEDAPAIPRVVLVVVDVTMQMLLYSATGQQISACAGTAGHFCEQVHKSKIFSLAASLSAGLAAIAKDVSLPFSVWPNPSD